MGMSDFRELSIVLQGPVDLGGRAVASRAAETARRIFPGAEIIVSCWEGDKTGAIKGLADLIVVSPDPGSQSHSRGVLNVNRQLVSSRAGAVAATRTYVLKARSDLTFRNSNVWRAYQNHSRRFLRVQGREPILITNVTSVNPHRQRRYFSLCDWVYLARKDVAIELFSAPFFPDDFLTYEHCGESVLRFNAEQWITLNYLFRHGLDFMSLTDGYQISSQTVDAHYQLLGRHFALTSWFRLGMGTQKHRIFSFSLDRMYTQREWDSDFAEKYFLMDFERFAVSALYSKLARVTAQLMRRFRNA
jgi:hypothetical protein